MSSTSNVSASPKTAYQRPYKTRGERREVARRKHDENTDRKFLIRLAFAIGAFLLIAVGVVVQSSLEADTTASSTLEARP
jgi:cell division septal protein FtsQ